jgi:hypothetical protein
MSNEQIAQELDLNKDDVYQMTTQLRQGIVAAKPEVTLSGEVECDEVYISAGHKGNPEAVKKGLQGTAQPPSRDSGQLTNVQQAIIKPLIKATINFGSLIYTDEYAIYSPLIKWGYKHKTVCHGRGEYARSGRW